MLKDFPFEKLVGASYGFQLELGVNWKTGQQTNMESYHAEKLHLSPMFGGTQMLVNPGNRPINMKLMKKHRLVLALLLHLRTDQDEVEDSKHHQHHHDRLHSLHGR